jgi:DNA-binding NtrC family response regulator
MDVLLVEDDPLQREAFALELEEAGLEVETAEAAPEALWLLQLRGAPLVVLTDLRLGRELGGITVAEEVLRHWPGVSVVYVTGNPQALCGRALGTRECYLSKPVRGDSLSATVWNLIARNNKALP